MVTKMSTAASGMTQATAARSATVRMPRSTHIRAAM